MAVFAKSEARMFLGQKLNASVPADYHRDSAAAVEHAVELIAQHRSTYAVKDGLLYTAVPRWKEIDVSDLESRYSDISFDYVAIDPLASLPSKFYDVVLVPLFGFNDEGYRLGRGSGWYDRFLATQPQALRVGIGLEASRIEFNPESHDVALDVIVTQQRVERYTRK